MNASINEFDSVTINGEETLEQANAIHEAMVNVLRAEIRLETQQAVAGVLSTSEETRELSETYTKLATVSPVVLNQIMERTEAQVILERKVISIMRDGPEKEQHKKLLMGLEAMAEDIRTIQHDEASQMIQSFPTAPNGQPAENAVNNPEGDVSHSCR